MLAGRAYLSAVLAGTFALAGAAAAQRQFTYGTRVQVAMDALEVRTAPGLAATVVGVQHHGANGTVVDASPHWADGFWWWKVGCAGGPDDRSAGGGGAETYLARDNPSSGRSSHPGGR